ncbi:phosphoglycerate mutase-like protein [Rickenella mellea]|uniref:Phosphoglycerate mutase-like protein n=1 Tax=Rickenella mellea TaxID=50990 RepID=A0A4Y7Q5N7_9AGAM|nr:phosphoglycerate mutase-like protein [Rickenella mellea]
MGILGVVILARHGDREEFFQDPYSYETAHTTLTPLGEAQEVQLGSFLRSQYLNPDSPQFINGISTDIAKDLQLLVRADNGAESGVIADSAVALLQGLYPPTPRSAAKLANGTTIVGPFGGYQYIPIETVEPEQSIDLEGWTECPAFREHIQRFYDSPQFKKKAQESGRFLDELKPYLFGRSNNLENMWNIFDFINVNYIHNETFAFRLPPTFLEQARALANFHELGVFTDKETDGIGNVAGRTILPSITGALERIANPNDPLSLVLEEISYKPFLSLFNITGIHAKYPDLQGIPEYASAIALELRNNDEGETYLRTKFKNGTTDSDFRTLHLFGHKEDIALNEFVYRMNLAAIDGNQKWCGVCNQRTTRGCSICTDDVKGHPVPHVPTIESGTDKPWAPLLGAQNLPFFALFAFILAFFGVFKLYKSRRPRLQGYDPIPTAATYYDVPVSYPSMYKQGY